jgi:hypothetical protein
MTTRHVSSDANDHIKTLRDDELDAVAGNSVAEGLGHGAGTHKRVANVKCTDQI